MNKKLELALEAIDFLQEQTHGIMKGLSKNIANRVAGKTLKTPQTYKQVEGLFNKHSAAYKEALANARQARITSPIAGGRGPAFKKSLEDAKAAKQKMREYIPLVQKYSKPL